MSGKRLLLFIGLVLCIGGLMPLIVNLTSISQQPGSYELVRPSVSATYGPGHIYLCNHGKVLATYEVSAVTLLSDDAGSLEDSCAYMTFCPPDSQPTIAQGTTDSRVVLANGELLSFTAGYTYSSAPLKVAEGEGEVPDLLTDKCAPSPKH